MRHPQHQPTYKEHRLHYCNKRNRSSSMQTVPDTQYENHQHVYRWTKKINKPQSVSVCLRLHCQGSRNYSHWEADYSLELPPSRCPAVTPHFLLGSVTPRSTATHTSVVAPAGAPSPHGDLVSVESATPDAATFRAMSAG